MTLPAAVTAGHWAFQPVRPVEPPAVRDSSWVKTPVDRFILSRLEAAGLKPSLPATGEQLVRRMFLGLTGLPPSPEEVDAFLNDRSPAAYERLIDRLLGSPQYGERWARHWLDLARYAESDGFEHDAVRPHSWRYRDYVIRAFNEDRPYDRFIQEQLAGDELWPEEPEALVATGFNLLGPDMVDSSDQIQRRLNTLNDMTDTAASVFLGLTLSCARCHDHKFEPFTQRDYFAMQAFFAPAEFRREYPVPAATERAVHETAMAEYNSRTQVQRRQLDEMEAPYRQKLFDEKLAKLSEDAQVAHRTPQERRTMEQEATVQETAPHVIVTEADVIKALSAPDKARRASLEADLKKIPKPRALPLAMVLHNTNGVAPRTCVLARGDYNNPREEVQAGFPAVLSGSRGNEALSEGRRQKAEGRSENQSLLTSAATKRRAVLADWMASADNPLTARVMVNRLWQHHFGRALVTTPSDFGTRGHAPTHPELLDWLAGEFIRGGWSVKKMHKLILLSATYQQSSAAPPEALAADPDNKFFSRQNRARLEGEVIRDSLLAISGRLNRQMGGPSVAPPIPDDMAKTAKNWTASANSADQQRRSIYVFARRNLRFPFLEVFDAPDSNLSCPERGHSTTAPQSLTLLNSAEVMVAAQATAERLAHEATATEARVDLAYRLILGRHPAKRELVLARDFLQTAPLSELCRALFNLNAFVYAD
ncbi:MAG TPA: DUF1549 and DUF1553 domain-containing protein [Verrucomicrobiae bacterium]|jgi:hypothetical protein